MIFSRSRFSIFASVFILIVLSFTLNNGSSSLIEDCAREGTNKKIKISLCAISEYYCLNDPISVRVVFENISSEDILTVNPKTCKYWVYFQIRNSNQERIKPKLITNELAEYISGAGVELVILKKGAKIQFDIEDITIANYGQVKYIMEEGTYFVTATFKPIFRYITRDGREAYTKDIRSKEIKMLIKKCKSGSVRRNSHSVLLQQWQAHSNKESLEHAGEGHLELCL